VIQFARHGLGAFRWGRWEGFLFSPPRAFARGQRGHLPYANVNGQEHLSGPPQGGRYPGFSRPNHGFPWVANHKNRGGRARGEVGDRTGGGAPFPTGNTYFRLGTRSALGGGPGRREEVIGGGNKETRGNGDYVGKKGAGLGCIYGGTGRALWFSAPKGIKKKCRKKNPTEQKNVCGENLYKGQLASVREQRPDSARNYGRANFEESNFDLIPQLLQKNMGGKHPEGHLGGGLLEGGKKRGEGGGLRGDRQLRLRGTKGNPANFRSPSYGLRVTKNTRGGCSLLRDTEGKGRKGLGGGAVL